MGFVQLSDAYPWDKVAPYAERARSHPGGIVDLSIGTPVDPTPAVVQQALSAAADAPGYPTAHGTPALREAVAAWFRERRGAPALDPDGVLPTVGSKELVATLPSLLGLGPDDVVVVPSVAYPTYDVGARLAGAQVLVADDVEAWAGNSAVRLVWVNSPSNPTGAVLGAEHLRQVVTAARDIGAVVASDECYAELAWSPDLTEPFGDGVPCLLQESVSGGDHTGLLVVYSLSKQSNLAGYRAAFAAGDAALVHRILQLRRHMGMMVPAPVQAATIAALGDPAHVQEQRERYRRRREALLGALTAAGYAVDHSEAGLYLWVRPADAASAADCWSMLDDFAARGILVGPGEFYGSASGDHVRVALTASDDRIARAVERLAV
ncbi:succinyldiaminopimelate transaminase [Ruania halotolerans]|uniref:succinyldiaminopimelate transaminase n=1 Tax=Ruania halotolerans TaxID=2897773 RepID=UPI001E4A894E|nr:succinyldiaminopimelate transaminase [Ruania halotolerans]UFU07498.1 succinyldiaminopimelate transaminase [Ruania halotolerans]